MKIEAIKGATTFIGRLGENEARVILFPVRQTLDEFPGCAFTLLNRRPEDATAYPAPNIAVMGDFLCWTVTSGDLTQVGFGECEVVASVDGKIVKSEIYQTVIKTALDGSGTVPEPWESWVTQVTDAADRAEEAVEHYPQVVDGVWMVWDAETESWVSTGVEAQGPQGEQGEQGVPGVDGFSPVVTVSKSGKIATVTVTDAQGTTSAEILDGEDGRDGQDGRDGADGFSPEVTVTELTGGHRVAVTDAQGTDSFDVMDGVDGQDGAPGADGFSPSASVSKVGKVSTLTVTDKDGTTSVEILDGADTIDDTAGTGDLNKTWSADKIKGIVDNKAPVVVASASGSIASFSDGSAMPVKSLVAEIVPVQSGTGDPAPDNVRPISGWTGCNLARTGKNLIDVSGFTLTMGTERTKNIDISKMTPGTYTFSVNVSASTTTKNAIISIRDKSGSGYTSIGQITIPAGETGTLSTTFTSTIPFAYIYVYESSTEESGASVTITDIRLEIGSTSSAYTPYVGTTYPISWQTEAGTVYGGNLNVTTGVLTVTDANIASYNGETLPGEWISDRDVYVSGTTPTTGAQVVYKLAEAETYQLTPVEVTTLLGLNNIWADSGDVSVDYCADTKTYVDGSITSAVDAVAEHVVNVTGTTPTITGVANTRYICGTCATLSITPPQSGCIDVLFTSGSTPTVLTVPNTVLSPAWFNPTSLVANTVYEINILDGVYGTVMAWA